LYVSGQKSNGCDSFSYIIVRSGWVETGYEMGVPDSNKCYGSQTRIESYDDCAAAAQALGMFVSSFSSDIHPQGCFEQFNEVFFNTASVGAAMQDRTPICKKSHTLLIRQTSTSKFFTADEFEVNPEDPENDNYAILNEMEDFRSNDGRFYFRLTWPNADEDVTYEWSQSSNPLFEDVSGYEAIDVPYTGRGWGGLEPSTNALMDGSVLGNFASNWFYAVGSFRIWGGGIPAYAKADNDNNYAQDQVELYVQKRTDASCYDQESIGYFLSSYPTDATKCNPGSCTFAEAKSHCDELSDCGGVTLNKDGLFTVRRGTELRTSPTGETSWLKSDCDAADARRSLETKENSTLKNRLIDLQN